MSEQHSISFDMFGFVTKSKFMNKLQYDYENRSIMKAQSPEAFRHSVELFGDFYHQAGLSLGSPMKLYAMELKNYLEMLLESGEEENIELFTSQLFKNGNGIRTHLPQDFAGIMEHVHDKLGSCSVMTKNSRLWLLLAMDLVHYNFKLPPFELQEFYVKHLNEKAFKLFERLHMEDAIKFLKTNYLADNINNPVPVPCAKKLKPSDDRRVHLLEAMKPKLQTSSKSDSSSSDGSNPIVNASPRPILGQGHFSENSQNAKKLKPSDDRRVHLLEALKPKLQTLSKSDSSSSDGSNPIVNESPRPILGQGLFSENSQNQR